MTPEQHLWARIIKPGIPPDFNVWRSEVRIPEGFPDLFWSGGYGDQRMGVVELKVDEDRVRPLQRVFLKQAGMRGGSAFVLAQYKNFVYLLDSKRGLGVDCSILYENAVHYWKKDKIDHEFLWYLLSNPKETK